MKLHFSLWIWFKRPAGSSSKLYLGILCRLNEKESIMRKALFALLVAGLVLVASTTDAFAQRGGRGGGRGGSWGGGHGGNIGWGVSIGTPIGSFGIGHGGGFYGGYGYGGYGYGGYGYPSYGYGYSQPYYYDSGFGYGYSQPYYDSTYMTPSYNTAGYSNFNNTMPTQSFYQGPNGQQGVMLTVTVPAPDAQLWVGDTPLTQQTGTERVFQSPPLSPGSNYYYTLKARWMENGQPVERERTVNVQPGQRVMVDFRAAK